MPAGISLCAPSFRSLSPLRSLAVRAKSVQGSLDFDSRLSATASPFNQRVFPTHRRRFGGKSSWANPSRGSRRNSGVDESNQLEDLLREPNLRTESCKSAEPARDDKAQHAPDLAKLLENHTRDPPNPVFDWLRKPQAAVDYAESLQRSEYAYLPVSQAPQSPKPRGRAEAPSEDDGPSIAIQISDAASTDDHEKASQLRRYATIRRLQASASELETELQNVVQNKPNVSDIHEIVQTLLRIQHVPPSTLHYEAMLHANCDPVQGSATSIKNLLAEMQEANMPIGASTYEASLRALTVHPDHRILIEIQSAMKDDWSWMPHSTAIKLRLYIALIQLRSGQLELAYTQLQQLYTEYKLRPHAPELQESGIIPTSQPPSLMQPPLNPIPAYPLHKLLHALLNSSSSSDNLPDFSAVQQLLYFASDQNIHIPASTYQLILSRAASYAPMVKVSSPSSTPSASSSTSIPTPDPLTTLYESTGSAALRLIRHIWLRPVSAVEKSHIIPPTGTLAQIHLAAQRAGDADLRRAVQANMKARHPWKYTRDRLDEEGEEEEEQGKGFRPRRDRDVSPPPPRRSAHPPPAHRPFGKVEKETDRARTTATGPRISLVGVGDSVDQAEATWEQQQQDYTRSGNGQSPAAGAESESESGSGSGARQRWQEDALAEIRRKRRAERRTRREKGKWVRW